jgi:hypothetical protein
MQQYSADNGKLTPWHMAYLSGIIIRGEFRAPAPASSQLTFFFNTSGAGLTFVEGSAVTADGRITPQDAGLWEDAQIASHREIVEFAHSQGQKIGVQVSDQLFPRQAFFNFLFSR